MGRLIGAALLLTLGLLAGCEPSKARTAKPDPLPPTRTEQNFETPYFPSREAEMLGHPVSFWDPAWTAAAVYTSDRLTDDQKAFVAGLGPAGGEGLVALGFSKDFDQDGNDESVVYGAWAKGEVEGNFVLVVRLGSEPPEVLLLQQFEQPPQFTVFTLKPDNSLWFGGGIDAGEVTMNLTWTGGKPEFHLLTGD